MHVCTFSYFIVTTLSLVVDELIQFSSKSVSLTYEKILDPLNNSFFTVNITQLCTRYIPLSKYKFHLHLSWDDTRLTMQRENEKFSKAHRHELLTKHIRVCAEIERFCITKHLIKNTLWAAFELFCLASILKLEDP